LTLCFVKARFEIDEFPMGHFCVPQGQLKFARRFNAGIEAMEHEPAL